MEELSSCGSFLDISLHAIDNSDRVIECDFKDYHFLYRFHYFIGIAGVFRLLWIPLERLTTYQLYWTEKP